MKQIYDTLINLDDNMGPIPGLAERWVFENDSNGNPTRLRLFLKKGIKFHNGEELKAADVKFTLDRASKSPHIRAITGMIEGVDAVNDYEVLVRLPYPFAPILNHLGHTATSIVNEKAVRELGDEKHSQNPIGTGPMKFVSWVAGDRVELTRWDGYHGTAPRIKNLTIRSITDPATRMIEVETGGVDLVIDITPQDISRVESNPDLQLIRGMTLQTDFIGYNCQKPPFNNVKVRQALNHAIDLNAINKNVYAGAGSTANGPINSMVWASAADILPRYEYNPAKARQLLAEAGYPNGFNTTVSFDQRPVRTDTAEIMQNMLRQVGVNVEIKILEWGAYLDMSAKGEHDMFILGWVTVTGDPDYGLHATFHSQNWGASGNRSFYSNPEVDRLLDAGRRETDLARREQIYIDAQKIIHGEAAWISQWAGEGLQAAGKNLRGFKMHPAGHHHLWTVWFE
jgi:peptide/nickel transport system substrate-binding protein